MAHNRPHQVTDVDFRMRRGDTLWKLLADIQRGSLNVRGRAVIVLGVGTNDLDAGEWKGARSPKEHAEGKLNVVVMLIEEFTRQSPNAYIVLCSVLPRPIDDHLTSGCVKEFNRLLRAHAFRNRMGYVPTWTSFVEKKPHHEAAVPRGYLYTAKELHLNNRGAQVLYTRLQQALARSSLDLMAARAAPPFSIQW